MRAFISYSHQDSKMLVLFHKHLSHAQREGLISTWSDNEIRAGGRLNEIIFEELKRCNLFIALVSPDYIASNYCFDKEFSVALDLYEKGSLQIIPIVIEPCDWLNTPFSKFKAIPLDGKAISLWKNKHEAFVDCIKSIRALVGSNAIETKVYSEQMARVEIEYIYSYSLNFPLDKDDEIVRQPVLQLIENYFSNGKNVIFLEGEEDTGKTTILKQFVKFKYSATFSSFLNPINIISSGTEQVLQDLCLQLHWYVYKTELEDLGKINLPYYQTLLIELKRKKRRANDLTYFVIDGLPVDSKKHIELIKFIFEILPIGVEGYGFLFSGDFETYKSVLPANNKIISTPLGFPNFSEDEVLKYFKECNVSMEEAKMLWKESSGGIPGKLANFKRLLRDESLQVNDLLDQLESSSIYDYDWIKIQRAAESETNLLDILAFIAIDEKVYSVSTLSRISGISHETILKCLKLISSVAINSKDEIVFFSNKHKTFFKKKLILKSKDVYNKNISYLRSKENSIESLLDVPTYFEKLDNYNEIVLFISEDYLPKIITECETLPEIDSKIRLGFLAAKKVNKDSDVLRFAIQGSLLKSIEGLHIWESELEARIALDDYENAIKLASSALLKEDRMRLLAKIGKQRIKKGLNVDEAILSQLRTLYNEVDFQELGDNALSIASDLLYCLPELAVNLIQKTANRDGKNNINDWLLKRLALSSFNSDENIIRPKITTVLENEKASSIHNALNFLYGDYTTPQLLVEVKKIERASDRFFFLRLWLAESRFKKDIELVIDFALEELLKNDSKEVLNTSLLRDLSSNLEHISNSSVIMHLCRKFGDFRDEARMLGPTVEYFRFELNISKALIKIDYNMGIGLLLSLEKETYLIDDILIKTDCLALIKDQVGRLREMIMGKRVHQYLLKQVDSGLENSLNLLLNASSNHYESLRDIIKVISVNNPEYAVQISLLANTNYRRMQLLALCFTSYVDENSISSLSFSLITNIYQQIDINVLKDDCIRVLLDKCVTEKGIELKIIDRLLPIIDHIKITKSTELKCYLNVQALHILNQHANIYSKQILQLELELYTFWNSLNSDLRKIEIGFFIASDLSGINRKLADDFLTKAKALKDGAWPDSMNTIEIYINSIKLSIRVFIGFVQSNVSCSPEFEKIQRLISNIPAVEDRIYIWSYFARFLLSINERNYFQKIVRMFLKPFYDEVTDSSLKDQIFVNQLSEIFYVQNSSTTLRLIKQIPEENRDIAYENILNYLLYECHVDEDYEDSDQYKQISHDDVESIIDILNEVVSDILLYQYLNKLCKAIQLKKTLTEPQKKSITRKLDELIEAKLPNPKFIKHRGFLIVSKAQLIRIDKQRSKDQLYFQNLIRESDLIKNLSDKAYVKALLAEIVNPYRSDLAKGLIKDSLAIMKSMHCDTEYIKRIDHLGAILHRIDISLWKECLKSAIQKSLQNSKENSSENPRKLIDIAYKYDRDFARNLISLFDKDEIRNRNRKTMNLKKHYNMLEIKNKIVNGDDFSVNKKEEFRAVNMACGIALGELNSSLIISKSPEKLRNVLEVAIKLSLRESFSIFEFYFQSIVSRVKSSNDSRQFLIPYFNSCVAICNIAETLSLSAKERNFLFLTKVSPIESVQSINRPESKEKAMSYIRNWLSENAKDYILIHDPYFNKEQLEILKLILEVAPEIEVEILTSVSPGNLENASVDLLNIYSNYWKTICHQDPPFTKIIVCFTRHSKINPVHDRWIITNGNGLTLGTSLNSLGSGKEATIVEMSASDAEYVENEILKKYLLMKAREYKNEVLDYIPIHLR